MTPTRWLPVLVTLAVALACGGPDGDADTAPEAAGTDVPAEQPDDLAADDPGGPGDGSETSGPLPVCACPTLPASGSCRSCSSLDNGCEVRAGGPFALRCSLATGCLEAEDCSHSGPLAGCDQGHCTHVDPGPDTTGPDPLDVTEPGPEVVEVVEWAAPGSLQAGQACHDASECADEMWCVSGEYTQAHCNPMCVTVADCTAAVPNGNAQCAALSGGSVCIWFCGMMGGECPGDLTCDGAACR